MEVKERIRVKAEELFHNYGTRSVTMDEIARQMGISKKTIYLSYKDKDQLVDDVFSGIILRNQEICSTSRTKADNAIHEGFIAMQMLQKMMENLNPNLLFDLKRNHSETFEKFLKYKQEFLYRQLEENLKWGIEEGFYRDDLDINIVIKSRLENMMLPFNPELFPVGKYKMAELQSKLLELFLFSIVSLKGYKLVVKYKDHFKTGL